MVWGIIPRCARLWFEALDELGFEEWALTYEVSGLTTGLRGTLMSFLLQLFCFNCILIGPKQD